MKKFLLASALLVSCAHQAPKTADDLQINHSYPLLSAKAGFQACELKAQNVMTVAPTEQGLVLPMELLKGTAAYVCGSVDCSKQPGKEKEGTDYYCGPFEILKDPADQSSKSE